MFLPENMENYLKELEGRQDDILTFIKAHIVTLQRLDEQAPLRTKLPAETAIKNLNGHEIKVHESEATKELRLNVYYVERDGTETQRKPSPIFSSYEKTEHSKTYGAVSFYIILLFMDFRCSFRSS